jgi:hypothetical protein
MSRTHDCKPQRQHGTGAAGKITPSVTCTGSHDRRGTASSATTPGSMTTLGRGLAEWVCDHPSVHADDPLASDPLASLSRGFGALAVPDQARRRRPPRSRARRSCFCCCTSGGSRSNRPGTHHRRGPAGGSGLLAGGGEDCEGARRRGRRCALPTGPGLGRWAKGGAPAGAGRGATVMSSAVGDVGQRALARNVAEPSIQVRSAPVNPHSVLLQAHQVRPPDEPTTQRATRSVAADTNPSGIGFAWVIKQPPREVVVPGTDIRARPSNN